MIKTSRKKNNLSFILTVSFMPALIIAIMLPTTIAWFTDRSQNSSEINIEFATVDISIGNIIVNDSVSLENVLPGDTINYTFDLNNNQDIGIYAKSLVNISVLYKGVDITYLLKQQNMLDISSPVLKYQHYDAEYPKVSGTNNVVLLKDYDVKVNGTVYFKTNLPNNISDSLGNNYQFNGNIKDVELKIEVIASAIQEDNINNVRFVEENLNKNLSQLNNNVTLKDKTAVFVGDSITYGTRAGSGAKLYWELLKDSLELSSVTGMGVAGSCFSTASDYGTKNEPLINRYTSIPKADLISIFMGTNDYGHDTPLGNITDTTDISFYGALNVILPALQTKYPESTIVLVAPLPRYGFGTNSATGTTHTFDTVKNGQGYNLLDYVNALKEIGAKYSIPVIDMYNIVDWDLSNETVRNTYTADGLHPNELGHEYIANIMEEWYQIYINKQNKMILGNNYQTIAEENINNYLSVEQNIYFKRGTKLSLVDSSNYKYIIYPQNNYFCHTSTALAGGSINYTYTISAAGYYGICVQKSDDSSFNLNVDSVFVDDYLVVDESEIGDIDSDTSILKIKTGNSYSKNYELQANRASTNKNIYLEAGTIVTLIDSAYEYGIYSQQTETATFINSGSGTLVTGGWITTDYTIETSGWYGFALKKVSNADFDFTTDNTDPYYYFYFNSN